MILQVTGRRKLVILSPEYIMEFVGSAVFRCAAGRRVKATYGMFDTETGIGVFMERIFLNSRLLCYCAVAMAVFAVAPALAQEMKKAEAAPASVETPAPAPEKTASPVQEVPADQALQPAETDLQQSDAPAPMLEDPAPQQAENETPSDESAAPPPSLSDILGQEGLEGADAATSGDPAALSAATSLPVDGASAQASPEDEALTERKEAFSGAVNTLMPLKPTEIRRILELYDETSQAVETPIYPDPEPESAFVQASLEPGAKPVIVKTAVGNVTTLSIVDVTGQPWPIQDLTWAGNFQVEQPESGSHIIRITPQAQFAQGNVSMRLVGLNPPVIFSLKTERKSVHVRLDVQIPEVGPKGVLPPVLTPVSIKAGDEDLSKVLVGTPSAAGMSRLKIDGVDGRTSAYSKGGKMYLRTPYTLLSPAWSNSVQSADGMHVYALDYTPVLLLSDKGKMVRAYLSSMEHANGE